MDKDLAIPSISVMMPVYNCGSFIAEAIRSILDQTFIDFELIIVDDCSTDKTVEIINSYPDERVRLLTKVKNTGYIPSLNLAIEISKGKFLARMDGDDISEPTRLEKQVRFLEQNPDVAVCGTWYQLIPTGEVIKNPVAFEEIKIALLDYCALGHPTVMLRKEFLTANKLSYDQRFYPAEDYDLWSRIAAIGRMANLPEVLLSYRMHSNQVSARNQFNQVENSYLCKIRMMCYPLQNPNDADMETSRLLVTDSKIDSAARLEQILSWLHKLLESNDVSLFFAQDNFRQYTDKKKASLIRGFYLHSTPYSFSVLSRFFRSKNRLSSYFTLNERIRFIAKCVLHLR